MAPDNPTRITASTYRRFEHGRVPAQHAALPGSGLWRQPASVRGFSLDLVVALRFADGSKRRAGTIQNTEAVCAAQHT